jgi:hypothetical protein
MYIYIFFQSTVKVRKKSASDFPIARCDKSRCIIDADHHAGVPASIIIAHGGAIMIRRYGLRRSGN